MLFELLPHFARLMPMADRFLTSRAATDPAQEAALAAMAEGLRGDVGKVTEMHAGIKRALQDQAIQVTDIAVEVTRARMGVESIETRMGALDRSIESRIAGLEQTAATTTKLLIAGLVLMAGSIAMVAVVLVRLAHR